MKKQIKLKIKRLKFLKAVKENGDLYASIKPKEISKIISDEFKCEITPSEIVIKKEINKIGKFEIIINLHSEVQTKIYILVEKLDKLNNFFPQVEKKVCNLKVTILFFYTYDLNGKIKYSKTTLIEKKCTIKY